MVDSLRSRMAAASPNFIRKSIRMSEHYLRRQKEWFNVLLEMNGISRRDKIILLFSAIVAPLTALRNMDGFQPPQLLSDINVYAKGVGEFSLRAQTDDIIHILSAREPKQRKIIEQTLRQGDVFIDAGANIGFYTIIAANCVGPTGSVYAIEMMPPTAERLRLNLSKNNITNVHVIENALSHIDDEIITATTFEGKYGQSSIAANLYDNDRSIRYDVKTAKLDSLLSNIGKISLIKMDLEGAEYHALMGSSNIISRCDAILYENNAMDPRISNFLTDNGFVITLIDGHDFIARKTI